MAWTFRLPDTGPKVRFADVVPSSPVVVRPGFTWSLSDADVLSDQKTNWSDTSTPVSASLTVAVMVTGSEHGTVPDGPSMRTANGFCPM